MIEECYNFSRAQFTGFLPTSRSTVRSLCWTNVSSQIVGRGNWASQMGR